MEVWEKTLVDLQSSGHISMGVYLGAYVAIRRLQNGETFKHLKAHYVSIDDEGIPGNPITKVVFEFLQSHPNLISNFK